MKQQFFIIFLFLIFVNCYSQKMGSIDARVDSFSMWKYSFEESTNLSKNEKLGILILQRDKPVYNKSKTDSILPKIVFSIYPISKKDSINNFEDKRGFEHSCCFPMCGATIIETKNFVFWSNPFEITSAFECSGTDYTRWSAYEIFRQVEKKNYNSIIELIKELPLESF